MAEIMTGESLHMAANVATAVPVIKPNVYVVGLGARPSDAYSCTLSSGCIYLSGLISPPPDSACSFLVITDVYSYTKVV